jgi:hypothetical protein
MSKILKVINPWGSLRVGDTLEASDDCGGYTFSSQDNVYKPNKNGDDFYATSSLSINISASFAKELIDNGYLEEVETRSNFVNVFTEIDTLIDKYTHDLTNIDKDMINCPQCAKLERETVLTNLITLLNHLKKLKK